MSHKTTKWLNDSAPVVYNCILILVISDKINSSQINHSVKTGISQQMLDTSLVEIVISTTRVPKIWVNFCENTGSLFVFILVSVLSSSILFFRITEPHQSMPSDKYRCCRLTTFHLVMLSLTPIVNYLNTKSAVTFYCCHFWNTHSLISVKIFISLKFRFIYPHVTS